ncbi:hypothetical protein BU14_0497s0006 [Porphyra umbilicalis]|uniref:Uncharacterized protein n=1 Tax=Porphyra umbilicalis TaxID=2786 RepID=A0A1X6NTB5_PORUM|nr:hypothetical protein BU14_0497s0006 [Porphyra umbilicalis]|eukprot:OSX71841.1 hypothetical protein BU14_0497s0006 [Porphyra umbilicalis]
MAVARQGGTVGGGGGWEGELPTAGEKGRGSGRVAKKRARAVGRRWEGARGGWRPRRRVAASSPSGRRACRTCRTGHPPPRLVRRVRRALGRERAHDGRPLGSDRRWPTHPRGTASRAAALHRHPPDTCHPGTRVVGGVPRAVKRRGGGVNDARRTADGVAVGRGGEGRGWEETQVTHLTSQNKRRVGGASGGGGAGGDGDGSGGGGAPAAGASGARGEPRPAACNSAATKTARGRSATPRTIGRANGARTHAGRGWGGEQTGERGRRQSAPPTRHGWRGVPRASDGAPGSAGGPRVPRFCFHSPRPTTVAVGPCKASPPLASAAARAGEMVRQGGRRGGGGGGSGAA